jgi:hypothetical protein
LKADDSLKSFLFTLKNPHNIPARRFALKAEKMDEAIYCEVAYGPCFSSHCDIAIKNDCNANTESYASSYTYLGWGYTNDTGLAEDIVFTGSHSFQVEEIEVFEITA